MTPKLSLITGTLNRPESFKRLVDSIVRHTTVPWELVVSDASTEPYNLELPPQVRMIPERPRTTCVKGYNAAFRQAKGEWRLWLNDDAEVTPGYDVAAVKYMEAHPAIGLGALHYSEDGGPFHVNEAYGCIYPNFGIIRPEVGDLVGWFDEDLTMYGCDNSLAIRVLLAGHGVADIPDARIIHHSVKDQLRIDNQVNRRRDNETLTRKYMPSRKDWTRTFRQLRVHSGREPWIHGRAPEMVGSR